METKQNTFTTEKIKNLTSRIETVPFKKDMPTLHKITETISASSAVINAPLLKTTKIESNENVASNHQLGENIENNDKNVGIAPRYHMSQFQNQFPFPSAHPPPGMSCTNSNTAMSQPDIENLCYQHHHYLYQHYRQPSSSSISSGNLSPINSSSYQSPISSNSSNTNIQSLTFSTMDSAKETLLHSSPTHHGSHELVAENIMLSPIKNQSSDIDLSNNTNDNNTTPGETEGERRSREEEESIALARMLIAEEAEASHRMSSNFLQMNSGQFSQEDYQALQEALQEEEAPLYGDEDDEGIDIDADENLSYETLLLLGERIGDVKKDRWALIAKEHINKLETIIYHPKMQEKQSETDVLIKSGEDNACTSCININTGDDSEIKCLVCQFQYEDCDTLRRLPCGHYFHANCVDQWLMKNDICPYCRQTIVCKKK